MLIYCLAYWICWLLNMSNWPTWPVLPWFYQLFGLNNSQLAKLIRSIPLMLLPWNLHARSSWSKNSNYTKELQFLWICEIWSNFLKTQYFANNYYNKKFFCTHVTHMTVIIFRAENFVSTKSIFVFSANSPNVTQRSVSQGNAFITSTHPLPFLRKTKVSNNSYTLIQNNFRYLRQRSLN